jgi:thiol-disulfide isomerase/thioredoxin
MKKIYPFLGLFFCVLLLSGQGAKMIHKKSPEKDHILNVNIEGKKYDRLSLRVGLGHGEKIFVMEGQSKNKQNWTFSCPDSLYEKHKYMFLFIKEADSIIHRISFRVLFNKDTLKFGDLEFKKKSGIINLQYLNTLILEKRPETSNKTMIMDAFWLNDPIDPQLMALGRCITSGYSMFSYDTLTNEQRFQKYLRLTKEFPDSHYAVSTLSATMTRYQSKEDVQKIFSCFTKETQNSSFGKKIVAYLTDRKFKNSVLPSWNDGSDESIVKDTSKYTLVLFSASWCAPCHVQIPFLRDIYKDYAGKLDMVYVSIDEKETVANWKKMMIDQHIPWRSLLAVDKVKEIKEKYFVEGIPYSILVYPGGSMEKIDVRQKESVDKLNKILR